MEGKKGTKLANCSFVKVLHSCSDWSWEAGGSCWGWAGWVPWITDYKRVASHAASKWTGALHPWRESCRQPEHKSESLLPAVQELPGTEEHATWHPTDAVDQIPEWDFPGVAAWEVVQDQHPVSPRKPREWRGMEGAQKPDAVCASCLDPNQTPQCKEGILICIIKVGLRWYWGIITSVL